MRICSRVVSKDLPADCTKKVRMSTTVVKTLFWKFCRASKFPNAKFAIVLRTKTLVV